MRTALAALLLGGISSWNCSCPPADAQQPTPTSTSSTTPVVQSVGPNHVNNSVTAPPQRSGQQSGTVLFTRSTETPATATTESSSPAPVSPALVPPTLPDVNAQLAQAAERSAITITALDIDVHLHTTDPQLASRGFASRAALTLRNDGTAPLHNLRLQVSSTLHWDRIRIRDASGLHPVAFTQARIKSDVDHTGQLTEATIPLEQPLSPDASLALDVDDSGIIPQAADRLTAIGTPDAAARLSDWDRISPEFTGLRGFGNVVWYPVASTPVLFGDGSQLFDEIAQHRLRTSTAHLSLHLIVEFQPGHAPTVAFINGRPTMLSITEARADAEVAGVAQATFESPMMGADEPSIFVAIRSPHIAEHVTAWLRDDSGHDDNSIREDSMRSDSSRHDLIHKDSITNPDNIHPELNPASRLQPWMVAASDVRPFLTDWLGTPRSELPVPELAILELPEDGDAPFESGALLATAITKPGSAKQGPAQMDALDSALLHALARAWINSPTASPTASPEAGPVAGPVLDPVIVTQNSAQIAAVNAVNAVAASTGPRPLWLDEGLALFLSTLWIEKQHGRTQALGVLESSRPALTFLEPESPGVGAGQPLDTASSPVYYRTKAAYIFWMLRDLIGDPALKTALRNSDSRMDSAHLEKRLHDAAPAKDLHRFFADWINADKGLPELTIDAVYSTAASTPGSWLVAVDVANAGYAAADVPLFVRSQSNSATERIHIPARSRVVRRILIDGRPIEVQVNDGTVPESQATVHVRKID